VTDIDIKRSPFYQGFVTCATIYCGPDVDFGGTPPLPETSRLREVLTIFLASGGPKLFIENLDDAEGCLGLFKDYFEDTSIKKVWHYYSFDRAVLWNHGINVQGLGGDTMHMARLWHASRSLNGGYSLEVLTAELLDRRKVPMKERFGRRQLKKDGLPGKILYLPPAEELQRDPETRADFIDYATYDAEVTWKLRNQLQVNPLRTSTHPPKMFTENTPTTLLPGKTRAFKLARRHYNVGFLPNLHSAVR
jgi:DNA polymerase I